MDYECIKDERQLLECPFKNVEKEAGHNPYVIKSDGWYYVQCTCGARGPMAPRELEVTGWNNRPLKKELHDAETLMFKVVAAEKGINDLKEYLTKDKK